MRLAFAFAWHCLRQDERRRDSSINAISTLGYSSQGASLPKKCLASDPRLEHNTTCIVTIDLLKSFLLIPQTASHTDESARRSKKQRQVIGSRRSVHASTSSSSSPSPAPSSPLSPSSASQRNTARTRVAASSGSVDRSERPSMSRVKLATSRSETTQQDEVSTAYSRRKWRWDALRILRVQHNDPPLRTTDS